MMFILSISVALLLGFTACQFIFIKTKSINLRFLVNLSFPIGLGITSVIFIFLNLIGLSHWLIFLIEIAGLTFLLIKFNKYRTQNSSKLVYQFEGFNLNKLLLTPVLFLATLLYIYSLVMDVGVFIFDSIQGPHGLWDAWSCWNLIARFISRAPHDWPGLLHQMNAVDFHPDYPLLQRGFIARCWLLMGNESVWIPIASAFIFTFCTIGLVSSSVSAFTGNKTDGLIAGLILLCTPFYMIMGDSQYADNTVGYFYLATIVLLTLARRGASIRPNFLIAAGVTAGLAAWSKNEGLLFITCLFASQLTRLFFKNYKELLNELKYLFIGMAPVLMLVVYQKLVIAPPNQIISAQGAGTMVKLTDPERYSMVWNWFVYQFSSFGKWTIPVNPWWLILLGILIKGGINVKENNYSFISNFTWLILMLTGFFFVELVTPLGLRYYLATSVHRLFFQLFPSFIFIYFLAINGEKASKQEKRMNDLFKKIFKKQ
jgi:hypothetical protein